MDVEKLAVLELNGSTLSPTTDEADVPGFSPNETQRLLRKIDIRLVPFLALLYLYV